MSAPEVEPLSGIVLFPDYKNDHFSGINAPLARQLGMATNAFTAEDVPRSGTAHAIGYDPQLVYDLSQLHRNLPTPAGLSFTNAQRERLILAEFERTMYAGLREAGVARDGLHTILSWRRVELVLPNSGEVTVPVMEATLPQMDALANRPYALRLWEHSDGGALTCLRKTPPGGGHPLGREHTGFAQGSVTQHTVDTSAVLQRPDVAETVTYRREAALVGEPQTAPGYRQYLTESRTSSFEAVWEILPPSEAAAVHTEAAYQSADPLQNPAWRERLS